MIDRNEWVILGILAATYGDLQDMRKRVNNRLGAAQRDGVLIGDTLTVAAESFEHAEKIVRDDMVIQFRKVAPEIHDWVEETVGLGAPSMARLLGIIGHPVIATPYHWEAGPAPKGHVCFSHCAKAKDGAPGRHLISDPPYLRTVSQLWSYCGHGDPSRRKAKKMNEDDAAALGSPQAKTAVWNISTGCKKLIGPAIHAAETEGVTPADQPDGTTTDEAQAAPESQRSSGKRRSPYRDTYDIRHAATTDRGWTPGHAQADALRIVGKEILRDLWCVANAALDTGAQS